MSQSRRLTKMAMTAYGLSLLHRRSPWIAMWWSVLLPGFGHFYVGSTLKGFILMGWELAINVLAQLNLSIYHTILGEYELAGQVLRLEWAWLYPFIYLFALWDAYHIAVETNKLCRIEEVQKCRVFTHFMLHPGLGLNILEKRNPMTAAFFGLVGGGLGHLYNTQIIKAIMLTAWQVGVMALSNGHLALIYTCLGRYQEAAAVVDYQWLLFWPSTSLFNVIDAYTDTLDFNNLVDEAWEYRMRKYIRNPSLPTM